MTGDLLHLQPLEGWLNSVLKDVVRRGLLGKIAERLLFSPTGKYLDMSLLSWRLALGLQRSIATRRRAPEPGKLEGRSNKRRLPPSGEPSGVSTAEQGSTARNLYGPVQLVASLSLSMLASVLASTSWRVEEAELYTHAQLPAEKLVRCWTQRVGKGGVYAVNTRNGEDVVCADNVVRAFLPVGGQVAIGQVVAG